MTLSNTSIRRTLRCTLASVLVLLARSEAHADTPSEPTGLVAPALVTNVEPVYPAAKRASHEEATVVVTLTLDATGKVTNAVVATSGGADFDTAALEAASKLVFTPATRNGVPVAARIPFRFAFASVEDARKEAPAPRRTALVEGVVQTQADGPVPAAEVRVSRGERTIAAGVTDANGAFSFADVEPGKYLVEITAPGFDPYKSEETLEAGIATRLKYRLALVTSGLDIEVRGVRPPREATKHVLEAQEISRVPGTNGDAIRSIENLPGVARPPGIDGLLIVRGSAPLDTLTFVDGTPVPFIYHFGGVSSVVPGELLERLEFVPGNFGADYGRAMGGIVDVGLRSPKKDRFHGLMQFDMLDGRFVAEGPLGSSTRFMVAGRRSWVDVWLGPTLRAAGAGVSTAPVYYDYQAMLEQDISSHTTARVTLFGSSDRLALTVSSPDSSDPALGGDLASATRFIRVQGRTETRVSDSIRWRNTLSYGTDAQDLTIGNMFGTFTLHPLDLRSDFRAKLTPWISTVVGIDAQHLTYEGTFRVSADSLSQTENNGPVFGKQINVIHASGSNLSPAAYAMAEITPVRGLRLIPGARVDYGKNAKEWTVDPRIAARFDIVPGFPRTTIKGGVGQFHQPPGYEILLGFAGSTVKNSLATQYSAGVEQEVTENLEVSGEGFYKDLSKLVEQSAASNQTTTGVTYANTGTGKVYGAEFLVRYKPDTRFFGWIAYTLSRSERVDAPGQPSHLFDYDQTHILTALGSYKLGRGWELGARWRFVSGNPYTPAIGGVADFDAGAYAPVQGLHFSGRNEPYHKLDVRVDKSWQFASWKLSCYLDVQNVYNRKNPEGRMYNYNYSQSEPVPGLPLLPVVGIRGEL